MKRICTHSSRWFCFCLRTVTQPASTSPRSTGCGGETRKTCCAQWVGDPGAVESVTGLGAGDASLPLNCTSNQPPKPESSAVS